MYSAKEEMKYVLTAAALRPPVNAWNFQSNDDYITPTGRVKHKTVTVSALRIGIAASFTQHSAPEIEVHVALSRPACD